MDEIPVVSSTKDDAGDIDKSVERVHLLINALEDQGVPAKRIVVGGFSQGGAIALQSAFRYPRKLGGAVCLSGWVTNREVWTCLVCLCGIDTAACSVWSSVCPLRCVSTRAPLLRGARDCPLHANFQLSTASLVVAGILGQGRRCQQGDTRILGSRFHGRDSHLPSAANWRGNSEGGAQGGRDRTQLSNGTLELQRGNTRLAELVGRSAGVGWGLCASTLRPT